MPASTVEKETKIIKKQSSKLVPPSRYNVIVCNDDQTPVDFVISMLMLIFNHSEKSAYDLTLKVHNSGSAIAGTFNHEIAEQKAIDGTNLARSNGHPLIIKVEPE